MLENRGSLLDFCAKNTKSALKPMLIFILALSSILMIIPAISGSKEGVGITREEFTSLVNNTIALELDKINPDCRSRNGSRCNYDVKIAAREIYYYSYNHQPDLIPGSLFKHEISINRNFVALEYRTCIAQRRGEILSGYTDGLYTKDFAVAYIATQELTCLRQSVRALLENRRALKSKV